MRLFVACAPGLEPLLAEELGALGVTPVLVAGGVECDGDLETVLRANLELGIALSVFVRVASFRATQLAELLRKVEQVDFSPWIRRGGRTEGEGVEIRVRCRTSRLYHTGAVAERVRIGMGASLGAPPREPRPGEAAPTVQVRLDRDECTISFDTSGPSLHLRGYRLATAKAPLREDVARALIVASGWDRASPFVDPMMGAGTLPIEAAILARGLPPGAERRLAIMEAPCFDAARFATLRNQALSRALRSLPFAIHGSDRDAGAVRAATDNAERAGVLADLRLDCAPLSAAPWRALAHEPAGALVTNPPWGRRIGDARKLLPLYQTLGRLAGALPQAWRIALVTSNRRLAASTNLGLDSALLTDHGGTKVYFFVRR